MRLIRAEDLESVKGVEGVSVLHVSRVWRVWMVCCMLKSECMGRKRTAGRSQWELVASSASFFGQQRCASPAVRAT
jgi:hypothetical protein